MATNRDCVTVVSSGGTEGSPPGVWSLVKSAIIVGASLNNVDRFGPCPFTGQNGFGGPAGCYEPIIGNGYPVPTWNAFGLMFYDGPGRIENTKFVNFHQDVRPYLDADDLSFLNFFSLTNNMPCGAPGRFQYEGDAAIGWFQSNANSYPPTQYTENLTFDNVDLRHEVYTESVGNSCAPTDPFCYEKLCPSAPYYSGSGTAPGPTQLTQAANVSDLVNPAKCPNGTCYFYDQTSGLLFLNLVQEQPNSGAPYTSPLGSCTGAKASSDPACAKEDFYSCPGPGCELYTVMVDSSAYTPGSGSDCTPYGGTPDYTQDYPTNFSKLAYSNGTVVQTTLVPNGNFPHQAPSNAPAGYCPTNVPTTPAWPPTPAAAVPNSLQISVPGVITSLKLTPNVTPIVVAPSGTTYQLVQGQTYSLNAAAPGCKTAPCSCTQPFTVTATGWSSPVGASGENCCAMGPGGANVAIIGVGAPPFSGQGCSGP